MTFNATSPNILAAKAAGLVEHVPLRSPPSLERCILCPPEIDAQLSGKDPACGLPSVGAAVTIGRFVAGYSLSISRKKWPNKRRKRKDIELEQLEGLDEVWALCYRKPPPGWRMLGRFLEKDVLVLLRVSDKHDIGSDYGPIAADVVADWRQYLGEVPALMGDAMETYLGGGACYDVDKANGF